MNVDRDSNPYSPPSSISEKGTSWSFLDLAPTGFWLAATLGVLAGRFYLLPILADFDFELPVATQLLLSRTTLLFVGFATIVVFITSFNIPRHKRRGFRWLAIGLAVLLISFCTFWYLVPLVSLLQNLSE